LRKSPWFIQGESDQSWTKPIGIGAIFPGASPREIIDNEHGKKKILRIQIKEKGW
jgi:hypothetical protein